MPLGSAGQGDSSHPSAIPRGPALSQRSLPMRSQSLAFLFVLGTATVASAQATAPFTRTIIVPGSGTPAANGAALLAAVSSIVSPGPTNRWLVFLEPGEFDIGSGTVTMANFVDIQGSGRNSTHITSGSARTVLAPAGIDAEIRDLTLVNRRPRQDLLSQVGIEIRTRDFKLTTVNVDVEAVNNGVGILVSAPGRPRVSVTRLNVTAPRSAIGLDVIGSEGVILNELFAIILSRGSENIGIRLARNTGESILEGAAGFIASGSSNFGILSIDARSRISNNVWEVNGLNSSGAGFSFGIANEQGAIGFVKGTTLRVGGSNRSNVHILNRGRQLVLQSVVTEPVASLIADRVERIALDVQDGFVRLDQSTLEESVSIRTAAAGQLRVGASRLAGFRSVVLGTAVCTASYDAAYSPVPPGC